MAANQVWSIETIKLFWSLAEDSLLYLASFSELSVLCMMLYLLYTVNYAFITPVMDTQ